MKKKLLLLIICLIFIPKVYAKEIVTETHMESVILLDNARRYYTVDEIKKVIDALSVNDNSTLQLHMTDDENVGIECAYLDQTKENAIIEDGIYINPVTNKKFLSYDQLEDIMNYAKSKNVRFIPEIDVPAHMKGFFELAKIKFGEEYVRNHYDWDNPVNSGIAWGNGDEEGNIDLLSPNSKPFIKNILDEYTDFFKDSEYFHIGFDEYTFRPEMKIDYANELYDYLNEKGFKVRMWSDAITKDNIGNLNNNIEITYWGWKNGDISLTNYATVKDLQEKGFKVLITNKYYLFFVPNPLYIGEDDLSRSISNIDNDWKLEKWNYNFESDLDNHDNILGGMICTWGENSNGVDSQLIINHTINMYNSMFPKLDVYRHVTIIPDDEPVTNDEPIETSEPTNNDIKKEEITNPKTYDNIVYHYINLVISLIVLIFLKIVYNKRGGKLWN